MKRPCVIIHWCDTSSHNDGWTEASDMKLWADMYSDSNMISCGILLASTKKCVVITPLYNPTDDIAGIRVRIPRGCIRKITRIKY